MRILRHPATQIISIIVIVALVLLVSTTATERVGNVVAIATAVLGFFIILVQMRQDHKIKKAEFIYSLNQSFSDDEDICHIYMKLKRDRDGADEVFTDEDGRRMGSYVMFFMVLEYLQSERLVSLDMIDALFSNKFFLFCDNPHSYQYQLKETIINRPMLVLYERWYNYRKKHDLPPIKTSWSLADQEDLFTPTEDGRIRLLS
jgi:hypothetical protein